MKVYLVMYRWADYDNTDSYVVEVFDSEKKAKEYIENTYKSYKYYAKEDLWVYEGVDGECTVWIDEWEVQ